MRQDPRLHTVTMALETPLNPILPSDLGVSNKNLMVAWLTSGSWSFDSNAQARMQAVMDCVKGPDVISVGCRDGTFELTLAREHSDWKVVGIDIDLKSVDYANSKAIELGIPNATFFQVSIFDTFGANTLGTFDSCIAMEVLEHLPQERQQEANNNLGKYLKKRGRIIITVPASSHISDEGHITTFYREMFHGHVTWIPDIPFLWLGFYRDFGDK